MLVMGAALGSGWSHLFGAAAPDAGRYALMEMAAATAARIHAPLTAAVIIFELSGDYPIARGLGWNVTLEGRQMRSDPPV